MTPRERIFKALSHQEADRVPQSIRLSKPVEATLSPIFGGLTGADLGVRLGNDLIVVQAGINAMMEMAGGGEIEEGERYTSEWGVVYERQNRFDNPVEQIGRAHV